MAESSIKRFCILFLVSQLFLSHVDCAPAFTDLSSLLPGLTDIFNPSSSAFDLSSLGLSLEGLQSLSSLPAFKALQGVSPQTITDFLQPLTRLLTARGSPQPRDVGEIVEVFPELVKSLPKETQPTVDLNKIPPKLLAHILEGKQLPGIPDSTVQRYLSLYMSSLANTAEKALQGDQQAADKMPTLQNVPERLINRTINGEKITGLDKAQQETLKRYFLAKKAEFARKQLNLGLTTDDVLSRLPENFELEKVPKEFIEQLQSNEPVDLLLLPRDLLDSFLTHNPDIAEPILDALTKAEEAQQLQPSTSAPVTYTRSTTIRLLTAEVYDIASVDRQGDLMKPRSESNIWLYTCIGLVCLAALTLLVGAACFVIFGCLGLRAHRRANQRRKTHARQIHSLFDATLHLSTSHPHTTFRPMTLSLSTLRTQNVNNLDENVITRHTQHAPIVRAVSLGSARRVFPNAWQVLPVDPLTPMCAPTANSTPKRNDNNIDVVLLHQDVPPPAYTTLDDSQIRRLNEQEGSGEHVRTRC